MNGEKSSQQFETDQLLCMAEFLINLTLNSNDCRPLLNFANKHSQQFNNIEVLYKMTALVALRAKQYETVYKYCNAFPYSLENREMMKSFWIQAVFEDACQKIGKPLTEVDKVILLLVNPFPSTIETNTISITEYKMSDDDRAFRILRLCYQRCQNPSDEDKAKLLEFTKLPSIELIDKFFTRPKRSAPVDQSPTLPPKKSKIEGFKISNIVS